MKKLLLSTALLALTAGAAIAADLPTRKAPAYAPPPPPPPMWTGFYAGLNAGYGFGTNSNTQSIGFANAVDPTIPGGFGAPGAPTVFTGTGYALSSNSAMNQNGFIGGGQVGYNYQWGPNFLIGIEADMQGTGIRGTGRGAGIGAGAPFTYAGGQIAEFLFPANFNSIGATNVNAGVDWMGTVRGRLGYLFTPTMLVYATGGLTYGGVYANVNNYAIQTLNIGGAPYLNSTYAGGGTKSQTLVGWNVGGGLEWMFMPNWSLKAEGIYWNMGNMNVATAAYSAPTFPGNAGFTGTGDIATGGTRVNYQGVIARMGVNYHFNFGGSAPIVAKY